MNKELDLKPTHFQCKTQTTKQKLEWRRWPHRVIEAGRPPSLVLIDEAMPRQVAEESTAFILEDGTKVGHLKMALLNMMF